MSDLISRSALIAAFDKTVLPREFRIVKTPEARMVVAAHGKLVKRLIDEAPSVDAVPVVHGYNVDREYPSLFECSICHWSCNDTYYGDTEDYNYCPNCGAKMDGGEEDDVTESN